MIQIVEIAYITDPRCSKTLIHTMHTWRCMLIIVMFLLWLEFIFDKTIAHVRKQ